MKFGLSITESVMNVKKSKTGSCWGEREGRAPYQVQLDQILPLQRCVKYYVRRYGGLCRTHGVLVHHLRPLNQVTEYGVPAHQFIESKWYYYASSLRTSFHHVTCGLHQDEARRKLGTHQCRAPVVCMRYSHLSVDATARSSSSPETRLTE